MFIFLNIFWVFLLEQCVKNKNKIFIWSLLRPIAKRNPWSFKYSNSMEEAAVKMKKIIFPRKPHFCIDLHSTLTILMFLIYWRIMKPLLSLGTKLKLSQSSLFRIKKVPHNSSWKFYFKLFYFKKYQYFSNGKYLM